MYCDGKKRIATKWRKHLAVGVSPQLETHLDLSSHEVATAIPTVAVATSWLRFHVLFILGADRRGDIVPKIDTISYRRWSLFSGATSGKNIKAFLTHFLSLSKRHCQASLHRRTAGLDISSVSWSSPELPSASPSSMIVTHKSMNNIEHRRHALKNLEGLGAGPQVVLTSQRCLEIPNFQTWLDLLLDRRCPPREAFLFPRFFPR